MSYDPSNPEGVTPHRPEGGIPYDERPGFGADVSQSTDAVRGRVQMPAIFLIVTAILNLILAVGCLGLAFLISRMTIDEFEKQAEISSFQKKNLEEIKKSGIKFEDLLTGYSYTFATLGIVNLVGSPLIILAGIQMLRLRSYGLAVFGSVLAALPCISGSGCCGLGIGVGIWALVVLMNPEVRAAFAAMR